MDDDNASRLLSMTPMIDDANRTIPQAALAGRMRSHQKSRLLKMLETAFQMADRLTVSER